MRFRCCNFKWITVPALAGIIYACSPGLYRPTQEQADATGVSLERLQAGRQLYTTKCNSCHSLYYPHQFNEAEWDDNLEEMQSKAKITDAQKRLIRAYLLSDQPVDKQP